MVNEVNKIVYNTLVAERSIHLPRVGTLSIVRHAAVAESRSRVTSPKWTVEFSVQGVATSVVDVIAIEGGVDILRAEDIYSRWIDRVSNDSTLKIEGVGVLRDSSFVAERAFLDLFNTPSVATLHVKRRNGGRVVLFVLAIIAVTLLGAVSAWYQEEIMSLFNPQQESVSEPIVEQVENTITDQPEIPLDEIFVQEDIIIKAVAEGVVKGVTDEVIEIFTVEPEPIEEEEVTKTVADASETKVVTEVAANAPKVEVVERTVAKTPAAPAVPATPAAPVVESWTARNDIRHYVVAGTYSNMANAERAVSLLVKKYDDLDCKIFELGKMYAVAVFGSKNYDDCNAFVQKHRQELKEVWVFTPKKFR